MTTNGAPTGSVTGPVPIAARSVLVESKRTSDPSADMVGDPDDAAPGAPAVVLDSSSIVGAAGAAELLHTYTLPGAGANGVVPGPATKTTAVPSSEMSTSAPVIAALGANSTSNESTRTWSAITAPGTTAGRTYRRISEPVDHTIVEPSNDSAGAA